MFDLLAYIGYDQAYPTFFNYLTLENMGLESNGDYEVTYDEDPRLLDFSGLAPAAKDCDEVYVGEKWPSAIPDDPEARAAYLKKYTNDTPTCKEPWGSVIPEDPDERAAYLAQYTDDTPTVRDYAPYEFSPTQRRLYSSDEPYGDNYSFERPVVVKASSVE
jgi:hypothetical protein